MNDDVTIPVTRRNFLRTSAAVAAASTLPAWFLEGEARTAGRQPGPNDRPAIALVGCGGMGRGDAKNAARFGTIVALCDVDERQLAEAAKVHPGAKTFKDFRKLIERKDVDVVICGTVDHWHTLVSMAAMRAGKDVYCEKPLTLTIDEGKRLVATAREDEAPASDRQPAAERQELPAGVRAGAQRPHRQAEADRRLAAGRSAPRSRSSPQPAPEGPRLGHVAGPDPRLDYVRERSHVTFRYWWEYSGGTMTDWGAHHNDIALWGLGLDGADRSRSGQVARRDDPERVHGLQRIRGSSTPTPTA